MALGLMLSQAAEKAKEKDLWMTDFAKAKEKAQEENKSVLMDFTGSDWCPPCIKLDKEVFQTKKFKEFAKENLVLLKLDFPRRKQLPDEQKEHNENLAEEFSVRAFPTIVIATAKGKELGREMGYGGGGAEVFLEWVNSQLKKEDPS